VENGLAKHMLAATETPNRKGVGFTPSVIAALMAIGAKRMAVAVLLMKIVNIEVDR